ncbi:MAG: DJ-1/PfpI family protein [Lentisphaeria bacterium]|nr:DJ-1/PfpI family protein [Lentisphaeria bacterium]
MSNILVILAPGFEEIEAVAPADIWKRLGFKVTIAGLDDMQVTGAHGIVIETDALLDEVMDLDFDAVFLPGGMPGSTNLRDDERVCALVKTMADSGKITSAICAAPMVLSKCGVLKNHRFTMYPGMSDFLADGDTPCADSAVADGSVVTGKGPGAVFDFAAKVAQQLGVDSKACYSAMMWEH